MKYEVDSDLGDGQVRTFSILLDDPIALLCRFNNTQDEWCIWTKDPSVRGGWKLGHNSREDGEGFGCPANPRFVHILDNAYEELVSQKAVEEIILNEEV